MQIVIEIPLALVSLNEWSKWHYHKKKEYRESLAWEVRIAYGRVKHKPLQWFDVKMMRYGIKLLDWANLYGSVKPLEDVLVVATKRNPSGLGIIQDDAVKYCRSLTCTQELVKQGEQKTVLTITEIERSDAF